MKSYILSVISAAIICAVARALLSEKTAIGQTVKLLTGLMMTITVMAPLANISFNHISDYFDGLSIEASGYVEQGKMAAQDGVSGIIKSQTEAYILDKASRMGLEIAVEVELDDSNDSIPCAVTVTGALSPYSREVLSEYIEDDLGIPKEKHKWM